jgi:predicted phage gp36 major capsid-like protein
MDDTLKQLLAELQKTNQRLDALENGQKELRAEIKQQFEEVKEELRVIKDQTARNSELQSPVAEVQKQVDDLTTDVKLIKRAITNQ